MSTETRVSTLVVGGSGFLGAQLVRAANDFRRSDETRAPVGSASRDPARTPAFWSPREAVLERAFDALRPGDVERLIGELAPERVILAAALSRIEECESYPELARALNADLARRVARSANEVGARMVLISTDLVFGRCFPPIGGFSEDDHPEPVNRYGESKLAGEQCVREIGGDALIVRLPLLFGDSGGRGLGASDSLIEALRRGERPTVFRDEWRTPLDVGDAARAVIELAAGTERGLLHVAGPVRISRAELAHLVLRAAGKKSSELAGLVTLATRAERSLAELRPADVSLDATRAANRLATRLSSPREALARHAHHLFRAIP